MRDINLSAVGAVCNDCARMLGFTPKNKIVGAWMNECEVCHHRKPCTDLWNDWKYIKKGETK